MFVRSCKFASDFSLVVMPIDFHKVSVRMVDYLV